MVDRQINEIITFKILRLEHELKASSNQLATTVAELVKAKAAVTRLTARAEHAESRGERLISLRNFHFYCQPFRCFRGRNSSRQFIGSRFYSTDRAGGEP